jgi:hypothetical protein
VDLAFDDMHGQLALNRGRGQFLNFLGAPIILQRKKVYFSRLLRVCAGLKILLAYTPVYARFPVQVSLLSIGQQGFGHLFGYQPLLPIGLRIVQRQRRRKTTNTPPSTSSKPIHF